VKCILGKNKKGKIAKQIGFNGVNKELYNLNPEKKKKRKVNLLYR
jgi:hypothetical protein